MTIGAIVGLSILSLLVILCVIGIGAYCKKAIVPCVIVGVLILGVSWGIAAWYFSSTEAGKRAIKTQQSNLGGGIERKITVYDVQGDMIAEYEGKFDIEYDDDRILFDDEQGLRHIIYYPTGNVIIDEIQH